MNNTLKRFFVSALMVLVCITLVACNKDDATAKNNGVPFGDKYIDINGTQKINASMDALQMYEVGVKNYIRNVDFVASKQLANITTNAPIVGTMTQKLDSLKIKQDKIYYLDLNTFTMSGSPNVKIADRSLYQNGEYKVQSANKKNIVVDKKSGTSSVKAWPENETFGSLKAGLKKYPNDPTRINMFIINSDTVKSSTKPEYDAKSKTYTFDLVLDIETATEDYLENMKYQTKKGGISNAKITFKKLKLTVVMWDNGLIRTIATEEAYNVVATVLGSNVDSKTDLFSTTYFTYDRSEININNYTGYFKDKD